MKTLLIFPLVRVQRRRQGCKDAKQTTDHYTYITPTHGLLKLEGPCAVVPLSDSGQKDGGTAHASKVFFLMAQLSKITKPKLQK